ncbi:hypothetical protein RRU01S_12_00260 [Agrobacterium rubi TR3 = NBRC 13261]|uniref:ASCH domain-containing protein n=1 Tax=Agrobacterium rubi TR3 = NBRC 13261 TaxID=1368415 RepID=A0A081CUU7_9HYPH|nr:ASCH domain-containing protein [Agrobacterium rubi]MBP1879298.1 uncharacterized protein YhfF [Agrobacterium rubi]MCL6652595.1 ASCH domain-containing protein [Agrobacterium rubi]GAK70443.1 hypothetical protein RRU01S_12_00260 [Agrobacterium rubi TR3 = NBRC 13261]
MIDLPEPYRNAVTFAFGDTPKLADDLLGLVLAGKKTSTCGAFRDFGPKGDPMPVVGRRDVVLDGAGHPAAVIETVEVVIRRFDAVDAAFAFEEGEDDQTLETWRVGHEAYFACNGGFTPDMELVCERFRLIDILKRDMD